MWRSVSLFLAFGFAVFANSASAMIFTVTTTNDTGSGSLRQAILDANTAPGPDSVYFDIGSGPQTIRPSSALPIITGPVLIDGTTQPGHTDAPIIRIDGFSAGPAPAGLQLQATGCSVVRLAISGFQSGAGILIEGGGRHVIAGSYLGPEVSSFSANAYGIMLNNSMGNQIGLAGSPGPNVISRNSNNGIRLFGSSSNVFEANYVGTDPLGTGTFPNGSDGIALFDGSSYNTIGGGSAGARNIVSGNYGNGMFLYASPFNVIKGNLIGCDITGSSALGNRFCGINLNSCSDTTIGGTTESVRNVISGNQVQGIEISGDQSQRNIIQGNYIGTDSSGIRALGNFSSGIFMNGATNNLIGGAEAEAGNVISGNYNNGIELVSSHFNTIQRNRIGCDATGSIAVPNRARGISIGAGLPLNSGVANSIIANVISGNLSHGVSLARASNNLVAGNFIGTDATGTKALSNGGDGLVGSAGLIVLGSDNTIGGTNRDARNVVSGNAREGITISGGTRNVIQGNYIGLSDSGTAAVPNRGWGIYITGAASFNTIGGSEPGAGNVISGNGGNRDGGDGLTIVATNTANNVVYGNQIGTDATGRFAVPNRNAGVRISGANRNQIGGAASGQGNLIAFNRDDGVIIQGGAANPIVANSIHSNGRLGINLQPDPNAPPGVVTPNDVGDSDTGPNNLQNFPVITNVVYLASSAIIQGYLRSSTNRSFSIDVYANIATEYSGYGEGEFYLGNVDVNTDVNGFTEFAFVASATYSNQFFTATALDRATGDTSEFSAAMGGIRITSIRYAGAFTEVSFSTLTNHTYHLQRANSLTPPISWNSLATPAPIYGTGGIITVPDPTGVNMRFYRVLQDP